MSFTFADSHAHLADPAFDADREAVLARAKDAGARVVVCIGESPDAADRAGVLARSHPDLVAYTAGAHPHDAGAFDSARDLPRLRQHLADGAVAVGECGLDYHYDHSPRDVQRAVFASQLELAAASRRPVVVHTRDAETDTRAMMLEAAGQGVVGVLHCYTGSAVLADAAVQVGWFVSFSGIITFRKWTDLALLRLVPDDRLLVESDSPYLAPVPRRGRRNEPAWVAHTIEHLARVRGVEPGALAARCTDNTARLFGLAYGSER